MKPAVISGLEAPLLPKGGLVTIIGGSGFIGAAVTEVFARAGWRVRIACRNPDRAMRLKPLGDLGQIGAVRADVRVPGSLAAAVAGSDAVINLVGILDERGGQRFAEVQARGAAVVAQAAAAAGCRAFVQMSAIGADPDSPSAYGRSKAEGEAGVLSAFPTAAILRPSLVFGADDGFTNRFARLIARAPFVPVVAPATRFQPVFVSDVADAVAAVVARQMEGQPGGCWELGGPDVFSMREIMAFIARKTGHEKPLVDVPDAAAGLLAAFSFLPGAPITRDQLLMLQRDNVVSAGASGLAELGIMPMPMAAAAPAWLERYRPGGRFAKAA